MQNLVTNSPNPDLVLHLLRFSDAESAVPQNMHPSTHSAVALGAESRGDTVVTSSSIAPATMNKSSFITAQRHKERSEIWEIQEEI